MCSVRSPQCFSSKLHRVHSDIRAPQSPGDHQGNNACMHVVTSQRPWSPCKIACNQATFDQAESPVRSRANLAGSECAAGGPQLHEVSIHNHDRLRHTGQYAPHAALAPGGVPHTSHSPQRLLTSTEAPLIARSGTQQRSALGQPSVLFRTKALSGPKGPPSSPHARRHPGAVHAPYAARALRAHVSTHTQLEVQSLHHALQLRHHRGGAGPARGDAAPAGGGQLPARHAARGRPTRGSQARGTWHDACVRAQEMPHGLVVLGDDVPLPPGAHVASRQAANDVTIVRTGCPSVTGVRAHRGLNDGRRGEGCCCTSQIRAAVTM